MMNNSIKINQEDANDPICPHCDAPMASVSARKVESLLGVRFLYYCPKCRKVLGISHRKGFWMG